MTNVEIKETQSVYVLKHIRNKNLTDEKLFNCLLCGRCQSDCPVALNLNDLRITQRIESTREYNSSYKYLNGNKNHISKKAEVIYFAGCMTHLTPAIIKSMKEIFTYTNTNFWFLDEEKTSCCGRPLMQVGQYEAAKKLIDYNRELILCSGAKKLVVSCPICYKVFKEDYSLPGVTVLHHSEFLLGLLGEKLLPAIKFPLRAVYHDPCELGRGSGIYHQPRLLLDEFVDLISVKNEKEKSLCCGGSLGNIKIQMSERNHISNKALDEYLSYYPDLLVTACPLCKKTFAKNKDLQVMDLSEIVCMAITKKDINRYQVIKKTNTEKISLRISH
jgi:Fe-S oxidoreductase